MKIHVKMLLQIGIIVLHSIFCCPASFAQQQDCVVLIHGLSRSHFSMIGLELFLKKQNYQVVNKGYPSTTQSVRELANHYIPGMINECLKSNPEHIYFVTHSIGGVLLQYWLTTHTLPKPTRIVMLGPPNHGSPWANILHNNIIFKLFTGPSGQELMTQAFEKKLLLDKKYDIGVIAGDFTFNPLGTLIFHEGNDGKVGISSTKTENMSDFIVLPVSHTFMMNSKATHKQILAFFNSGKFVHHEIL